MGDRNNTASLDPRPDFELMELVQKGRQEAFSVLVHRHQSFLLNFFRTMGVYTDAEDLVQDTFVRLFRYRQRYQPTAKFTTFLYLLARQVWIDMLRRKKRKDEFGQKLTQEAEAMEKEASSGSSELPDVDAALRGLSETMRSVVVLNIYQGLKYHEIAEVLEIPLGTVKSRMFQAMHKLREIMSANR